MFLLSAKDLLVIRHSVLQLHLFEILFCMLMVKDKVGRPPGELGMSKSMEWYFFLQSFDTVGLVTGRASGL